MFTSLKDEKFKQHGLYYDSIYDGMENIILDIFNGNPDKYENSDDCPKIYSVLAEYHFKINGDIEKAKYYYEKGIALRDWECAAGMSNLTNDIDLIISYLERSILYGNPRAVAMTLLGTHLMTRSYLKSDENDSKRAYNLMIKGMEKLDPLAAIQLVIYNLSKRDFKTAEYLLEVANFLSKISVEYDLESFNLVYKNLYELIYKQERGLI